MISAHQAIKIATAYVRDIYAPMELKNLRLEEIEMTDDGSFWLVTIGFDATDGETIPGDSFGLYTKDRPRREFKVIRMLTKDGDVRSMKNLAA